MIIYMGFGIDGDEGSEVLIGGSPSKGIMYHFSCRNLAG